MLQCRRTLAGAVRHHGGLVLALNARQSVLAVAALETVTRTGAAVALVEHVLVVARLADHRRHAVERVSARQTVERTLCERTHSNVAIVDIRLCPPPGAAPGWSVNAAAVRYVKNWSLLGSLLVPCGRLS